MIPLLRSVGLTLALAGAVLTLAAVFTLWVIVRFILTPLSWVFWRGVYIAVAVGDVGFDLVRVIGTSLAAGWGIHRWWLSLTWPYWLALGWFLTIADGVIAFREGWKHFRA